MGLLGLRFAFKSCADGNKPMAHCLYCTALAWSASSTNSTLTGTFNALSISSSSVLALPRLTWMIMLPAVTAFLRWVAVDRCFGDGGFCDDLLAHFHPQAGAGFAGVVPVAFVRPVVRVRPRLEVGAEVVHGEADVRFQRLQFAAGIVQGFHPREVAEQVGLSARQLEVVGGGAQRGEQLGELVGDGFWQFFHGGAPGVVRGWVWLGPVVGGSAAAVSACAVTAWRIV